MAKRSNRHKRNNTPWRRRQKARRRVPRFDLLERRDMLANTVHISSSDMSAAEPDQNAFFGIFRSGDSSPLTVNFTLTGTATNGADYENVPLSITIPAMRQHAIVDITTIDDTLYEGAETVILTLQPGANYQVVSPSTMTATIGDNDLPVPLLSINDRTVNEAAGTAQFTVTLSPTSGQQVTVSYATASGTATSGADFTGVSGTLVFAPSESSKIITVPIIDDLMDEPTENYFVNLSGATGGAQIQDGEGLGLIIDNDDPPKLSIDDAQDWEDLGELVFTVTLSPAVSYAVSVNYTTYEMSAIEDVDYALTVGGLVFQPMETTKTVSVPIIDDLLIEGDEQFLVVLSNPSGARIERGIGIGTILDNEVLPGQVIHCVCYCGCDNAQTGTTEADGSVQAKDDGGLTHSTSSNPHPIVTVDTRLSDQAASADHVKIQLTFGGIAGAAVYYDPTGYVPGETVRFVLQADASTLPTGRHYWEMQITEQYGPTPQTRKMTGFDVINNLIDSEFGNRWTHGQFERLAIQDDGVTWVRGDGNLFWFGENPDGSFTRQEGELAFSTLVKNPDSSYTLTSKDGGRRDFNSTGVLVARADRLGNTSAFAYVDADGDTLVDELSTITDAVGRITTLVYSGGLISTITDFDGRTTQYLHDGARRLISIARPDPDLGGPQASPVTTFGYHPVTNLLAQMTNAANKTTLYDYGFARTLTTITNPDLSTRELRAYKAEGLVNTGAGTGTLGNPAALFRPHEAEGSITNELEQTTTFRTGRYGFRSEVIDPLGNKTEFLRNEDGQVVQVLGVDPDGAGPEPRPVTEFQYDQRGNVIFQELPDGSTRVWTYHPTFNEVTSFIDELGRKTLYGIDAANGNVLSIREVVGLVDPAGGETNDLVTTFTYTTLPGGGGGPPAGLVATMTDPMGRLTDFDYSSRGLATRITFAVGTPAEAFIEYEHSSADNLTAEIDELGRRTEGVYDELDRLTQLVLEDPDGAAGSQASPIWAFHYSAMSHVVKEVDPLGRETLFEHGAFGNLKKITQPDHDSNGQATITSLGHDLAGRLVAVTDPLLRVTTLTVDALGRTTATTLADPDAGGPLTSPVFQTQFDPYHRATREIDALGNATDYAYLNFGKRVEIREADPDGGGPAQRPLSVAEHDSAGQMFRWTDALGRVTEYARDDLGRIVLIVHPDDSTTEIEYDKNSNVRFVTEPGGAVTEYVYSERNFLVQTVGSDPDGAGAGTPPVTTFEVDAAGQVLSETDPLGRVTRGEFDGLGRLVRRELPDPDFGGPAEPAAFDYHYDAASRLVRVVATDPDPLDNVPAPETTYAYDLLDNLVSVVEADPDGPGVLESPETTYVFSAASELLRHTDALGRDTTWVLDNLGRPTSVDDELGQTTAFAYDGNSNLLTATNEQLQVTTHNYDNLSRHIRTIDPRGGITQVTFDAVSNVTRLTDSAGNDTSWFYDLLDRVTSEFNELGLSRQYVYSESGDLSQMVDRTGKIRDFSHDALHQLVKEEWIGNVVLPTVVVTTLTEGRAARNEVQQIVLPAATGGNWTLSFNGQTTGPIPFNATAMQVQSALQNLGTIGFGNVAVTGAGTPASPFLVAFQGSSAATDVPAITANGNGLSGVELVSVGTTTPGHNLTNEVQHISFQPNAGRYILAYESSDIYVYELLTAAELQSRFDWMWAVGPGNVVVTGTWPEFDVTFQNELGDTDVDLIQAEIGVVTEVVKGKSQPTNEVQTIAVSSQAAGGSFTLSFNGLTTGSIAYNAMPMAIQTALEGLSNIEVGDVQVSGNVGGPYAVTFQGAWAGINVSQLTVNNSSMLGGTITASTNIQGLTQLNEVQRINVNDAYSGTFSVRFDGQATGSIAYNAAASAVESALEALTNIDNVSVSGGAGGPYTVTFQPPQAGINLPQMTGNPINLRELVHIITQSFDAAGQLATAGDAKSAYAFTYDGLGAVTRVDNQNTPGAPRVILDSAYDALSRRTSLSAEIDGVDDLLNTYHYDALSRMTGVRQQGQTGGNTVATKGVDFGYNAIHQFTSIVRFTDLVQSPAPDVATSTFTYDTLGRLEGLEHKHAGVTLVGYAWQFDSLNRVTEYSSTIDGTSTYSYDTTSQLTGADHSFQADEAHTYDLAGNRTDTGYATGTNNRLLSDGTFNYTYNGEGNRLTRTRISTDPADDHLVEYSWDYRNRLVGAVFKDNSGAVTKRVELDYDVFDRRIAKRVDSNGDGSFDRIERWVYDGDDVLLDFVDPDGAGPQPLALAARYLHGPAVDQVLAQEDVATGEVLWQLADNLGTGRDLVDSDGVLVHHLVYEAFGTLTSGDATATRYQFTGREWDADLGLYYYRARWYDPQTGRFISEDPIGFEGGDANLSRYVGNDPTNYVDPFGLQPPRFNIPKTGLRPVDAVGKEIERGLNTPLPHPIPRRMRGKVPSLLFNPVYAYERFRAGDPEYSTTVGETIFEAQMFIAEVCVSVVPAGGQASAAMRAMRASRAATKGASSVRRIGKVTNKLDDAARAGDKASDAGRVGCFTAGTQIWFAPESCTGKTTENAVKLNTGDSALGRKGMWLIGAGALLVATSTRKIGRDKKQRLAQDDNAMPEAASAGHNTECVSARGSEGRDNSSDLAAQKTDHVPWTHGCIARLPSCQNVFAALLVVAGLAVNLLSDGGGTSARGRSDRLPSENAASPELATRSIEEVRAGDWVWARDEQTGQVAKKRVAHVFRHTADHLRVLDLIAADGGASQRIETTDEHPFWVEARGWVEAGSLVAGDQVLQADGQLGIVTATRRVDHPKGVPVYNIEVEGFHTYFVAAHGSRAPPVWVHNKPKRYEPPSGRADGVERAAGKNNTASPALEGSPYNPGTVERRIRPPYRTNPAHDPKSPHFDPRKTPEPADAAEVYGRSVRGSMKHCYAVGADGKVYRFTGDNAGTVHFTGFVEPKDLPKDVRKQLGI